MTRLDVTGGTGEGQNQKEEATTVIFNLAGKSRRAFDLLPPRTASAVLSTLPSRRGLGGGGRWGRLGSLGKPYTAPKREAFAAAARGMWGWLTPATPLSFTNKVFTDSAPESF